MTHWRTHPALADKLHPDYPDDLQVVVHDGGPRLTSHRPELVWVRITGAEESLLTGVVLNQPMQVEAVRQGSVITFLVPDGGPAPVMASKEYLHERPDWILEPCNGCGFTELLDAPSVLIAKVFPDLPPGARLDTFTAFCGLCGGVQVARRKDADIEDDVVSTDDA